MSFPKFVWGIVLVPVGGALIFLVGLFSDAQGVVSLGLSPRSWQIVGSIIFFVSVMYALYKRGILTEGHPLQTTELQSSQTTQYARVEEFYATYDNQLLVECENGIRIESSKYKPGDDRERFLTRCAATVILLGMFENTWMGIFRSQLLALHELNKNPMKIESLMPFYASATEGNSALYSKYPFTSWLAFMKSTVLIREDGDMASITVRGREFLKYLLHQGRSAEDRIN